MRFFIAAIFAISAWLFLGTTPINSQQIGVKNDSPIDTIGYAVWMDSVDVLISSRKLDQAQVLLDSLKLVCIQELGEKSPEFADILSQMARIKNFSYQAQEAIALNKAALAIRQLHFEAHSMPIYLTYESLGINYYYDAQLQEALVYFHKMEAIVLQQDPQEEEEEIASTFNLLGLTYNALTDFESAIAYFQKTLEIRKRIYGETHELVGISYNNLAGEFDELGDYNRAIAYKLKALSIIEKNTGNQNEFYATTAANIGVSNYEKGDYDQAIYWIKKGLSIQIELFGYADRNTISSLSNLAGCYDKKLALEEAIRLKKEALGYAHAIYGEYHLQVAYLQNNIGFSFLQDQQPDSAIVYCTKSIASYQYLFGGEHGGQIQPYRNLGMSYSLLGNFEKSKDYLHKSIEIAERTKGANQTKTASLYEDLGSVYLKQYEAAQDVGILSKADAYFEQAFGIYTTQLLRVSKPTKENLARYIAILGNNILKTKYQLLQITQQKKYKDEMFAFVEESRALILRQSILENTKNQAFSPPDSTTLARLQELKQTVLTTEIALQLLKDEEVPETDRTFIALHAKLFDLKERLTLFNQELASNQEGYFETVVSPSSVTRGQLQEALRISNQALLEYFVGDSSIFIFIIQADNYEVLEVRRDFPLADWVHQFRAGVSKPYAAGLKSYTKAAYQLYEKLFAPLGNNLPERLVIIPDGDLGYVPFDVLLTAPPDSYYEPENFAYLLRRHQISYSYSATFLLRMQEKQHRNPSKANLLAMAPFSGVDTVLSSQLNLGDFLSDIRTVDTLMPLPFSRLEVDSLRTLFGATSLYGKSATKVNFLQLATQFRILHLATHGKADALAGDYSYLVFAPQLDSLANELLYVRDIYNLELNSDLVVLSACETGIGQLQRGEGMISLARAFAYAGAKSITTTLWQVSDRSTQELMTLYYRHLFSGLHNDLALQQTKLSYLKSNTGAAAHPALWAAFIGIGDMRPIY